MKQEIKKNLWRCLLISIMAGLAIFLIINQRDGTKDFGWILFMSFYYFIFLSLAGFFSKFDWKRVCITLLLSSILAAIMTVLWSNKPGPLSFLAGTIVTFPPLSVILAILSDEQTKLKERRKVKKDKKRWQALFQGELEPSEEEELIMKAVNFWKQELSSHIKKDEDDYSGFYQAQIYSFCVELGRCLSEQPNGICNLKTESDPVGLLKEVADKTGIGYSNFQKNTIMHINFEKHTLLYRNLDDEWVEL